MDKKEYSLIGNRVVSKYKNEILPKLAPFEKERIKASNNSKIIITIALVLSVAIFIITFLTSNSISFNIPIAVFSFGALLAYQIAKKFENNIKKEIMKYFCECFGELKWISKDMIQTDSYRQLFADSNLFKMEKHSKIEFDDVFKGQFRELPFEIIEVESYRYQHSSTAPSRRIRHTHFNEERTICRSFFEYKNFALSINRKGKIAFGYRKKDLAFKGVVVKIKLNKNFNGNTVILPDTLLHITPDSSLKHTILEDVEFEKKFDVFTTDEVEARYLITTSFMERLNNLKAAFKVDKISCSFYDEYILIGLHTKEDLFKLASLNKTLFDYSEFSQLFKEVVSIYDMIDYFKLGEKTRL